MTTQDADFLFVKLILVVVAGFCALNHCYRGALLACLGLVLLGVLNILIGFHRECLREERRREDSPS